MSFTSLCAQPYMLTVLWLMQNLSKYTILNPSFVNHLINFLQSEVFWLASALKVFGLDFPSFLWLSKSLFIIILCSLICLGDLKNFLEEIIKYVVLLSDPNDLICIFLQPFDITSFYFSSFRRPIASFSFLVYGLSKFI